MPRHQRQTDTKLAEGTINEVSASSIKSFIDSKAQPSGLASLGLDGIVVPSQLPPDVDANLYQPSGNPIYNLNDPLASAQRGLLYFPLGFNIGGLGTSYKYVLIWVNDNYNNIQVSGSDDMKTWTVVGSITGLSGNGTTANHCSIVDIGGGEYRIYYLATFSYDISDLHTAVSTDLLNFTSDQSITQSLIAPMVAGSGSSEWNRASYGFNSVLFNSSATNTGSDPKNYSYMGYYDATTGAVESTALAYSSDGLYWSMYGDAPVLDRSHDKWDANYATWTQVHKISDTEWIMFYCGGIGNVLEGVGVAISKDALKWNKISITQPLIAPDPSTWLGTIASFPTIIYDTTTRFAGAGDMADCKMIICGGDATNWIYTNGLFYINSLSDFMHLLQQSVSDNIANNSVVTGESVTNALDSLAQNKYSNGTEISIKVYQQATIPSLSADTFAAFWIDTSSSNKVFWIFRRGTGDVVAVELS